MKKLLRCTAWFLIAALLVSSFSAYIDAGNLLHSRPLFGKMLDIMSEGLNVDGISDYTDRTFYQYAAERVEKPKTLVLGSSRSAQLDSDILGRGCWNASVTGATLEDCCAMFQVYRDAGKLGDVVVMNVDIWFFDRNKKDERTKLYLADPFNEFVKTSGCDYPLFKSENRTLAIVKEVLSLGYFQSCVQALPNFLAGNTMRNLEASDLPVTAVGMLRYDGSFVYPASYLGADTLTIIERVAQAEGSVVGALQSAGGIDPKKAALFEALCREIRAEGCELVLLLSPFHPDMYGKVVENGVEADMMAIEDYVRTLAAEIGADVIGSYNPDNCAMGWSDFPDALHLYYDSTARLFRKYTESLV